MQALELAYSDATFREQARRGGQSGRSERKAGII